MKVYLIQMQENIVTIFDIGLTVKQTPNPHFVVEIDWVYPISRTE